MTNSTQPLTKKVRHDTFYGLEALLMSSLPLQDVDDVIDVTNVTVRVTNQTLEEEDEVEEEAEEEEEKAEPNAQAFTVPRLLICGNSEYSKGAFGRSSKEGKDLATPVYEAEPWVFSCFVRWLNTSRVSKKLEAKMVSINSREVGPHDDDDPVTWE